MYFKNLATLVHLSENLKIPVKLLLKHSVLNGVCLTERVLQAVALVAKEKLNFQLHDFWVTLYV